LWPTVLRIGLQVVLPIVLVLTSVRLLLTNAFVETEYRTPGFPADPFGFTLQDRLYWAPIARDYLLNDAGISFLGDLRFPDGTPLYNERELRHMQDVKRLVQVALKVWAWGIGVSILLGAGLWLLAGWGALRVGLTEGARNSLILMALLVGGILLAFSFVFVGFHRIFFTGDTWLFLYSDTLIRLFPEPFWRDAFVAIGLLTGVQAGAVYLVARSIRPSATL
jgi:integral membrane protein (TIGR01906 family)